MSVFLKLKHWQLFIFLFGIPMVFQGFAFRSIMFNDDPAPVLQYFPIVMVLITGALFGWFYAIGTGLYKRLPSTVRMNLNLFKIFLAIPFVYILVLSIYMIRVFSQYPERVEPDPDVILVIVPIHLLSMICMFYILHFNAKALKSVEWQRQVTLNDFLGEFFFIWFFPIGVWFIQPRINKLFAEENGNGLDL